MARRLGAIGLMVVSMVLPGFSPALGAEGQTIGIQPAAGGDYLRFSLLPGGHARAEVILTNRTTIPVRVLVYSVDALTTPQGAFALRERHENRLTVGSWIKPDRSEVVIQPASSMRVHVSLRVPDTAPPGEFAGGVVVERDPRAGEASEIGRGTALQFNIIERVGLRTFVRVQGEALHRLTAGSLRWRKDGDGLTFDLPVRNTGNVRLTPSATLTLAGFGVGNRRIRFSSPSELLPGSEVVLRARVTPAPLVAWGRATARVEGGGGSAAMAHVDLHIVPWLLVLLCLAGVLLLAWIILRVSRFLRRARRVPVPAERPGAAVPSAKVAVVEPELGEGSRFSSEGGRSPEGAVILAFPSPPKPSPTQPGAVPQSSSQMESRRASPDDDLDAFLDLWSGRAPNP